MADSEKMAALIQLAGAVAHELNNIFTSVAGNLALLDEHIEEGSTPAEMIGEVVRTAQRGIALSAKLQAFAGRQPLKRKRVDINRVLLEISHELRRSLSSAIEIALTPAPHSCMSFVDEDKFRDTVKELAANAAAAMNGQGRLHIEAAEKWIGAEDSLGLRAGAYVSLRVTDTGPGMKPEIAARALDPMFSTKASHINAGWGLSNCAGFLRQCGGAMKLRTEPGRGTSVEIYLPADASAERQPANAQDGTRNVA